MKKLKRCVLLCALLCLCALTFAPAAMAEDAQTPNTYVLSFRPGVNGSFSSGALAYLSGFGNAQLSSVGNLYVELPAGSPFPGGISAYLSPKSGYYYKSGLYGAAVTGDGDYVAEYGVLPSGSAVYTVRYVDSASGTDLDEPLIGIATPGTALTFQARSIANYTVDAASKSLSVSDGAVLAFRYTAQPVTVQGQDTIVYEQINVAPVNPVAPANPVAPVVENGETETIPEAEIPAANPGGENPAAETENGNGELEEITDEEVPLTAPEEETGSPTALLWTSLALGLLLGAALVVLLLRSAKRKGNG